MPWMSRSFHPLLVAGLAAGLLAGCDSDDPTEPTTDLGSLTLIAGYRAVDISADGSTVLVDNPATVEFSFYDVAAGTTTPKGTAGDPMFDFVSGISNSQRVSGIHGKPEQAGLWSEAAGWQDLGNIYPTGCEYDDVTHEQNQSGGWDIDSAGHATVGLVWNGCNAEAFLWTDAGGAGGFVSLDVLGTGLPDTLGGYGIPSNRASTISDNGLVVAGFASDTATVGGTTYFIDRRPAIWQANGAGTILSGGTVFTTDSPGEIFAISADGAVVAGEWNLKPFVYSVATGPIDLTPGDFQGKAQAVARNGELVFGTYQEGFFGVPVPFVWTQAGGLKSLLDLAAANDVEIPANYWWQNISAVSEDGTIVTGVVFDEAFTMYTFVLKLPVSVYGL